MPLNSKVCKNLRSAQSNPADVDSLIEVEVNKGFLAGPYKQLPFNSYRVSPIGLVQGKYSLKKRLIFDLSAPHNDINNPSINGLIDKEECSLTYVKIDDAIKQILIYGTGAKMCKTDIKDAFKLLPILPTQYHLFCIKWHESLYFSKRLCFGCRSSPKIFDVFAEALCWIAQNNYNIKFIMHLLDDFLTIDGPDQDASVTMSSLLAMFNSINVPLSEQKTVGPSTVLEYLGIILDSAKMEARLPTDKVQRISLMLESFMNRKTCTKRELLQLLGHLNFASRVILPGRSFVSYLLSVAHSVSELHYHVHLTASCREDLRMWQLFLQQWNGVCLFHDVHVTAAPDLQLYTDAASTLGYGGYFRGHWFSEVWPLDLPKCKDVELSMAYRELYPIVVAAMLWGEQWSNRRILFFCDNSATVTIIKKGRSPVSSIMNLMRHLTWLAAKHNFYVTAEHVPGTHNVLADALSRLQVTKFLKLAPGADKTATKCPQLAKEVMWDFDRLRN